MKKKTNKQVGSSPLKYVTAALGLAGAGINYFQGQKAQKEARKQQRLLDTQIDKYKSEVYVNPYEDMQNVYEDQTVNLQAAEQQQAQFAQSQANTLQSLEAGAGSGAGAAALAMAMSRTGAQQAQRTAADIGKQEQRIQQAQLGEQKRLNQLDIQGEEMRKQQERERTSNLAAMYSSNVEAAQTKADTSMSQAISGGVGSIAGLVAPGAFGGGAPQWNTQGLAQSDTPQWLLNQQNALGDSNTLNLE